MEPKDIQDIIDKLSTDKDDRETISYYIKKRLSERLKLFCQNVSEKTQKELKPSHVVEELLEKFLNAAEKGNENGSA